MSTSHPSPDEILVVDDEPANLRLLQQLLGEAGYRVRLAKSGELALQSARIKPPAIVLLDVMMPEMDGYEVCRRLKEDQATRSIPVIFLSALESEQDKVKAFEVGGADYVVKPLRTAEVMARINTHLALRRAQIELERRNIELEAIRETLEERAEERSEELKHTNANLRREIEVNHKTVAALRKSERDYRRIIDTANEGIWMIGPDGKTVFANARMASMLGYDPKEMIGLPVPAFLHEEDAPDFFAAAEQLRNGLSLHLERRLRHKDGHTRHTIVSITPTFDDAQHYQGAFAMLADITARKQAEAEILRLNRELEERVAQRTAALEAANKEMEAFSYSVSHDLRAPLRAINGFASALEQDCASCLDDEGKRYLSLIRQGASRMARLIDDLLELSRSSKGKLGMRTVDMTALIQEVHDELREAVPQRNIQFTLGGLPPALCDRSLIRQVLFNLLSNAIKYTSQKPEAVIEVRGRAGQDANTYSIGDNGAGFDMKFASKLFGVFQRLHTYEEFEGNGIGLAIVKRIVERHGGHLWAEGEVGKGAVFYFTLPSVSEANTCAPPKERDTIPAAARLALSEAV